MILYSAARARRSGFRATSTISGPIPAQSPSVMPTRGLVLLLLMLVIVTEFAQSSTSAITSMDEANAQRPTSN
ncbi:MAG: hypothetical protein DMF39_02840 [Verrucomicrobia bacterium]|nr:MAG: hypothetical protein DMF39_02840 [Verrucomicrobiota bacterium]